MREQENLRKINNNVGDADSINHDIIEEHMVSLLDHYHRINEGADGVIGLIDMADLDDSLKEDFFSRQNKEKPVNEKLASKMLKVYSKANLAHEEGKIQKDARELLLKNPIEGVSVPEVYFSDSVSVISETLKNHLKADEVSVDNNEVGVVLMDFIEGEDMMTYIYKEAIKIYKVVNPEEDKKQLDFMPELAEVDQHLKHGDLFDFKKIENRASLALDLKIGRGSLARREARVENTNKLIKFLSDNNFILETEVIDNLSTVTKLFHKNGLYHRDLHERNIMFSFAPDEKVNMINIIDWRYGAVTSPYNEDVYEEGGTAYPNDDYVIWSYKKITKSKDDFDNEEFFSKLEKNLKTIKSSPQNKKLYDKLVVSCLKEAKSEDDDKLELIKDSVVDFSDRFIKEGVSFEDNFNLRLSLWKDLVKMAPELKTEIINYLDLLLSDEKRPLSRYANNTITNFISYLKKPEL
jgi:hypothetical protein